MVGILHDVKIEKMLFKLAVRENTATCHEDKPRVHSNFKRLCKTCGKGNMELLDVLRCAKLGKDWNQ